MIKTTEIIINETSMSTIPFHTISVEKSEALCSFYKHFLDHLSTNLEDGVPYFEEAFKVLGGIIESIKTEGFCKQFLEGYSLMFLPEEEGNFVFKYFLDKRNYKEQLIVNILEKDEIIDTISQENIMF